MKRILSLGAWGLFVLLNIWMLVESFDYFRQNPTDLIYVGCLALAGGATAIFYYFPSLSWRRRFRLMMYGLLTSGSAVSGVWVATLGWKIRQAISPVVTPSDRLQILQLEALLVMLILGCGIAAFRFGKQLFLTLKAEESSLIQ